VERDGRETNDGSDGGSEYDFLLDGRTLAELPISKCVQLDARCRLYEVTKPGKARFGKVNTGSVPPTRPTKCTTR
jgi:hypothetical protein